MPRLRLLAHRARGAARGAGADGGRRAARAAQATGQGRPRGPVREQPGDLLPDRVRAGLVVEHRPRTARGGGPRTRDAGGGGRGAPRPGREHQAVPAVRPQLRVLLRGPVPRRRPGHRLRAGRAEPGRRHVPEALRGQQPGDRPGQGQRRRGRADPARDLPPGLRAGRHRGEALDGDVLLQPGQRHARLAGPVAADHGAPRRVGLRGRRRLRLGRRARPGRGGEGRAGPRDAAAARLERPGAGRRGARRGPRRGRARRRGAPDAAPGRPCRDRGPAGHRRRPRGAPRPGPRRRARGSGAAQERRAAPARSAARREGRRGG